MNKNLPESIAVFEVLEVNEDQHCRHDAVARTYDYFIHLNKNPLLFHSSSLYEDLILDYEKMKKAVSLIRETKDFKAMCKQPDLYDNTICLISNCELFVNQEEGRIRFTITSNRFLRGMIRICVYFLIEVGRGAMTLDEFNEILTLKKDVKEKWPAHPNGLFLSSIEYPNIQLDNSHNLIRMLKVGLENH